ncbi:MAG: FAD-dependent monooxygenase [Methylophilaceae bacterium]|nr:FAD-dependent monooxygenase [Methylophilaceae bacterium]MDG1820739.1 FAD-dependent monooxygenase [Methylophilaceae bacterium]
MAIVENKQAVVIVGGGPVGLVLALSMQQQGLPFKVLEAHKQGANYQDKRALALSYGSKMILESLGVWQQLAPQVTMIKTIHVSQRGSLGRTKLQAAEYDLPALGYVVSYGAMIQALDSAFDADHILYEASATAIYQDNQVARVDYCIAGKDAFFETPLLVIAEGGRGLNNMPSLKRDMKAYGHDALVSKVRCEASHHHIAYERFTPSGPMALLPNGEHDFSLVWTGEKALIDRLLSLDDATFLAELHEAFGNRVGRFLSVQKRLSFPLIKSQLSDNTTPHMVVIGNSAQTMHPVAGQGFNVGLRDATTLMRQLSVSPQVDWGSPAMLEIYAKMRARDTKGGLLFTDFLVSTFNNDLLGISGLRSFGLGLLDVLPSAKQWLVSKMSYGK